MSLLKKAERGERSANDLMSAATWEEQEHDGGKKGRGSSSDTSGGGGGGGGRICLRPKRSPVRGVSADLSLHGRSCPSRGRRAGGTWSGHH